MELSKYQKTISEVFTKTNNNMVIDACPGSGKTFMLCHLAKKIPPTEKSIFLAFNKSIAEELGKKLPFHIQASTLHSLGFKTLMRHWGSRFMVNSDKTFILTMKMKDRLTFYGVHNESHKKRCSYVYALCHLYDLIRMNLITDLAELKSVAFDYDLPAVNDTDIENMKLMMSMLEDYNKRLTDKSMVDFTDMLWLCKDLDKKSFNQYNIVFVDEGQDLNPLQKVLVEKILSDEGRFVVVGDEKQSIYTFTGANVASFREFKNKPNTVTLPLSVTYRCSQEVTKKANEVFDGMECFEQNEVGSVKIGELKDVQEGDFILCRNNKPLVQVYIELLAMGKKAVIYGKDYGEKLLKLLNKVEATDKVQVYEELNRMRQELINELKSKGIQNPDMHPSLGAFDEMYAILELLLERMSVGETKTKISEMFSEDKSKGIVLMTCHKSKGLEADNVFFLNPNLIPSTYAQSAQMLYAEKCLYYVTVTRAKKNLIYISI